MGLNFTGSSMVPIGAIIAAVIAGGLSFTNLVTSKEQKVSEFRQQWIDALRLSIAEYLAALSYLSFLRKQKQRVTEGNGQGETFAEAEEVQETYLRVEKAYNDIILRINPNETDPVGKQVNKDFLAALQETRAHYDNDQYADAASVCANVRETAKPLLKYEWTRVKNGEPAYKRAKTVAAIVPLLGFLAAAVWLWLALHANNGETPVGSQPHVSN